MDIDKLPKQLETVDDYLQSCENFVLPFLFEQSKKIAAVIEKMHTALEKGQLQQEELEFYVNSIAELTAFADESSPMYHYFKNVVDLEHKLQKEGLIHIYDDDEENSE